MKINVNPRKIKAVLCMMLGILSIICFVWFLVSRDMTTGILAIINMVFFLNEDREYKAMYGNRKKGE